MAPADVQRNHLSRGVRRLHWLILTNRAFRERGAEDHRFNHDLLGHLDILTIVPDDEHIVHGRGLADAGLRVDGLYQRYARLSSNAPGASTITAVEALFWASTELGAMLFHGERNFIPNLKEPDCLRYFLTGR